MNLFWKSRENTENRCIEALQALVFSTRLIVTVVFWRAGDPPAGGHGLAQHVPRGEVDHVVRDHDLLALRAFARGGRAGDDDLHRLRLELGLRGAEPRVSEGGGRGRGGLAHLTLELGLVAAGAHADHMLLEEGQPCGTARG